MVQILFTSTVQQLHLVLACTWTTISKCIYTPLKAIRNKQKTVEAQTIYKLKSRDSFERTGVRHTDNTRGGMSQLFPGSPRATIFRLSVRVVSPSEEGPTLIRYRGPGRGLGVSYWKPTAATVKPVYVGHFGSIQSRPIYTGDQLKETT